MDKEGKFSGKHGKDAVADPAIESEIKNLAKKGELPCAVAFKIAEKLNVLPGEVGKAVDLLNFSLTKCQMGLFGYTPEKRIVKAQDAPNPDIEKAIRAALVNDRLPCASAWKIAAGNNLTKLAIGGVCEGMGVKIKPCQLGAF